MRFTYVHWKNSPAPQMGQRFSDISSVAASKSVAFAGCAA
jgi:hypothetical protein